MNFEKIVPIHEIESSLDKVLQELQGKNKTRACLFNLLIYTKENTREKYIQNVIEKIVQRFPCRMILFIDKGVAPQEIRATISVIELNQGQSDTFCDCIQFEIDSQSITKIPFLALPHLVTDLPNYLLWADDPNEQNLHRLRLETFCSRIIFDSETSQDLLSFSKNSLKYQIKSAINIADLNWARIESIKNLMHDLFFVGNNPRLIEKISDVIIRYNQTPSSFFCHTKIQSTYLAIWFALQANLSFRSAHSQELIFTHQDRDIRFRFEGQSNPNVTAGRLLEIEIDFSGIEHFLIKRKEKNLKMMVIYHTKKDFCEIPSEFLLEAEESGASTVNEVFHSGTSPSFMKVLNFIAHQPVDEFCL